MWRRSAFALTLCAGLAGCVGGAGGQTAADASGSTSGPTSSGGSAAGPTPPGGGYSGPAHGDLQSITQAALADAAHRTGRDQSTLKLVSAESVTWRDGSLGCSEPGMTYTQALVPGYRIRIQAGAEILDYHAGRRGQVMLCPPRRALDPLPGEPR
jgi:hypothetical protein